MVRCRHIKCCRTYLSLRNTRYVHKKTESSAVRDSNMFAEEPIEPRMANGSCHISITKSFFFLNNIKVKIDIGISIPMGATVYFLVLPLSGIREQDVSGRTN